MQGKTLCFVHLAGTSGGVLQRLARKSLNFTHAVGGPQLGPFACQWDASAQPPHALGVMVHPQKAALSIKGPARMYYDYRNRTRSALNAEPRNLNKAMAVAAQRKHVHIAKAGKRKRKHWRTDRDKMEAHTCKGGIP